jgi:hypothetical protein
MQHRVIFSGVSATVCIQKRHVHTKLSVAYRSAGLSPNQPYCLHRPPGRPPHPRHASPGAHDGARARAGDSHRPEPAEPATWRVDRQPLMAIGGLEAGGSVSLPSSQPGREPSVAGDEGVTAWGAGIGPFLRSSQPCRQAVFH